MTIGGGWVGLELGAGGALPGDAVMSGTSLPLSCKNKSNINKTHFLLVITYILSPFENKHEISTIETTVIYLIQSPRCITNDVIIPYTSNPLEK